MFYTKIKLKIPTTKPTNSFAFLIYEVKENNILVHAY